MELHKHILYNIYLKKQTNKKGAYEKKNYDKDKLTEKLSNLSAVWSFRIVSKKIMLNMCCVYQSCAHKNQILCAGVHDADMTVLLIKKNMKKTKNHTDSQRTNLMKHNENQEENHVGIRCWKVKQSVQSNKQIGKNIVSFQFKITYGEQTQMMRTPIHTHTHTQRYIALSFSWFDSISLIVEIFKRFCASE